MNHPGVTLRLFLEKNVVNFAHHRKQRVVCAKARGVVDKPRKVGRAWKISSLDVKAGKLKVTATGKAAGLTFLIGPYTVGPYVEGAYEIALPASSFRSLLAVAYADEFGGRAVLPGVEDERLVASGG